MKIGFEAGTDLIQRVTVSIVNLEESYINKELSKIQ